MFKTDLIKHLNYKISKEASKLIYTVKDEAPNTENALFSSTSLVIWSGASEGTIFGDKAVNYAFRALHDTLHLKTGLGFSPKEEIELGRIQASKYEGIVAEIVYSEVSGQAEYYLKHGEFVNDQVSFTYNYLKMKGVL